MLSILVTLIASHATATSSECGELLLATERLALEHYAAAPQPPAAVGRVATNRALGMSWATALDHEPGSTPDEDAVARTFASSDYGYEARSTGPFFPARFTVFPTSIVDQLAGGRYGFATTGQIFAMYLTGQDRAPLTDASVSGADAHVRDAFAHLRFVVRDQTAFILEIQSDAFGRLPPERQPEYRPWSRAIVLAFERYVADRRAEITRIVIAGPEYQLRRWPEFNVAQAEALYHHLPRKLGYRPATTDAAFETSPRTFDEDEPSLELIGAAFGRTVDRERRSPARQDWDRNFRSVTVDRWARAHARLAALKAPLSSSTTTRIRSTRAAHPVGFTRLPPSRLYVDPAAEAQHARLLARYPAWARELTTQTLVSTGRAAAGEVTRTRVAFAGGRRLYEHFVGQDRHPSVRVGADVLTLKGGGRRSTAMTPELGPGVFATRDSTTPSHRVWGGLSESHGRYEFNAHLGVFQLAERAGFEPSIARPLDVGWFSHVPHEGRLEPIQIFYDRHLHASSQRLVQARFIARTGARVLAVAQIIHSESFASLMPALLRETYAAFGEKLRLPELPAILSDTEDHAAALRTLAEVARRNGDAGRRILAAWTFRTLRTIGLLHGYGGHWGGTQTELIDYHDEVSLLDEPIGAPSGGSTQMRNVSVAGELRDLDENVYLPGILPSPWDRDEELRRANLPYMIDQDLRHWRESRYWMDVLLLGRADAPAKLRLPKFMFGDPSASTSLIVREIDHSEGGREREAFIHREFGSAPVYGAHPGRTFDDAALEAAYRGGFEAGRRLRTR